MVGTMRGIAVRRVCAALMVLAFVVGLPMQGIAMASAAAAMSAPWSADAGGSTPWGCNGCADQADMGMLCPVVFCIGISAVISTTQDAANVAPDTSLIWFEETGTGLSSAPDPDPPRISAQT